METPVLRKSTLKYRKPPEVPTLQYLNLKFLQLFILIDNFWCFRFEILKMGLVNFFFGSSLFESS